MKLVAGLLLIAAASLRLRRATASSAPFPGWSWDNLATFTYGSNETIVDAQNRTSGADSPEEIDWKVKYDLVLIDNVLSSVGCSNTKHDINWTSCNDFKAERCADIKKKDPKKPCFVYRGGPFGCFSMEDQSVDPDEKWYNYLTKKTLRLKDTWLVDRAGVQLPGQCDFRKQEAQDYWLTQQVFGPNMRWLKDKNVDGMFSDSGLIMGWGGDRHNITIGDRNELFNATSVLMKRMAQGLHEHNKILTFSLKDHFSSIKKTGGGTSGGTLCDPKLDPNSTSMGVNCFPYGEEVLFEIMGDTPWIPFREYNIPSRDFGKAPQPDGCAAAIVNHAMEAQRGPTLSCNNDGSMNKTLFPSPYGNISWFGQHEASLAAHMLGMEEGSYFGSGMHWSDVGWHVWWPEYDKPLGRPKGPFTRNGYTFTRSFEHVDVTFDCSTLKATFRGW
jgi:hypothetical protein